MSQIHVVQSGWKPEHQKPLFYRVWLVGDRKWHALFLLAVMAVVVTGVFHTTESFFSGFLAFCMMLSTIAALLLPVHIEINAEGIVRTILGRKSFIAWEDIRGYRTQRNGMLLLSRKTRFLLEAFRGCFLPIPPSMMPEVQYRFRIYVDKDGN